MEKRKPHCPLPVIRDLIEAGKVRATRSAACGALALALALGLDFDGMV